MLSPHPRAQKVHLRDGGDSLQAALEAGAPEDIIQCIDIATLEGTNALMRHERTGVILSTGGAGIVKAAYSSGKPAFGVGPGNVPVLVDTSADLDDAIPKIVAGKSFDYGTVCSSEQAIVAEHSMRDRIISLLKANKAYICNEAQKEALGKLLITPNWTVNPQCVGQAPTKIAKMAGFEVPPETSIICAEVGGVGKQHPLSAEKLSPVLSLYFVQDFNAALDICFGAAEVRRGRAHRGHLFEERRAHPRIRAAHAGQSRAGEYAGAAGFHRNHDQRLPFHDAGLRRGGGQHYVRQCRAAASDQHQAARVRGAQAGRSLRDAARLQPGAWVPGSRRWRRVPVDRNAVVAAVERYLASRGIAVAAGRPGPADAHPSLRRLLKPSVSNAAREVVDRFLARRGAAGQGGYG